MRLVKESEELGDLPEQPETPQLWNAQPFQLAPTVPLPECAAGCARAQPLVKWTRQMHGTGGWAGLGNLHMMQILYVIIQSATG